MLLLLLLFLFLVFVVVFFKFTGGKNTGKYLTEERTLVLMSRPSALNTICQTLRVTSLL